MNKKTKEVLELALHNVFGFGYTILIGTLAILLDKFAVFAAYIGASAFTCQAIELTAHAVLVLDLVLFLTNLIVLAIKYVKGMLK